MARGKDSASPAAPRPAPSSELASPWGPQVLQDSPGGAELHLGSGNPGVTDQASCPCLGIWLPSCGDPPSEHVCQLVPRDCHHHSLPLNMLFVLLLTKLEEPRGGRGLRCFSSHGHRPSPCPDLGPGDRTEGLAAEFPKRQSLPWNQGPPWLHWLAVHEPLVTSWGRLRHYCDLSGCDCFRASLLWTCSLPAGRGAGPSPRAPASSARTDTSTIRTRIGVLGLGGTRVEGRGLPDHGPLGAVGRAGTLRRGMASYRGFPELGLVKWCLMAQSPGRKM